MQRDFTYIDDCVESILRLMQREPAGHDIFNIGNHAPVSLDRFILAIETATGKLAIRNSLPMQPGDVPVTCADVSKLMAATGFAPATRIEDGIAKFVDWYRTHTEAHTLAA
jgi:UDP-glucuronate 4-epimerase